jgi:hypothetical protein
MLRIWDSPRPDSEEPWSERSFQPLNRHFHSRLTCQCARLWSHPPPDYLKNAAKWHMKTRGLHSTCHLASSVLDRPGQEGGSCKVCSCCDGWTQMSENFPSFPKSSPNLCCGKISNFHLCLPVLLLLHSTAASLPKQFHSGPRVHACTDCPYVPCYHTNYKTEDKIPEKSLSRKGHPKSIYLPPRSLCLSHGQ